MPGKHRPDEKQVSVWMDESERAVLDRLAVTTGKKKSAVILDALKRWDDEDRVPRLEAEVERLTQRLETLASRLRDLEQRLPPTASEGTENE